MLTIPLTAAAQRKLTHAVRSKTGALCGAHRSEAQARDHAKELNESESYIDRLNGPYHVEPYRK